MLWPVTAERDSSGRLTIGDISVPDLADQYGTPLYIYDERTIRQQCRSYREAFQQVYPNNRVVYAGKAFLAPSLIQIIHEEGLSLDVVSGGELYVAIQSGFPAERITFHGNNKTPDELRMALDAGVGEIVIDNFYEIELLSGLLAEHGGTIDALLRLNPGIDTHTHDYRKTGIVDSKFGLLIETGDAADAVERITQVNGIRLRGYHIHLGSQIFEIEPYVAAIEALFGFATQMRERFGIVPDQISPGGGLGIQYESTDPDASVADFAKAVADATKRGAEEMGIELPELVVEPGRSIIGPAGVAVYRVGSVKDIPGVRRYVCVDGGMADNIRPPLYDAVYEAAVANRSGGNQATVTIAGKYCESGDVLIKDARLLDPEPGDLIAVPASGAYCLAMASNYNMALRPAVVMVRDGQATVMQRRERYEDLLARDVTPGGIPVR
ncbi:MAG: diaminopimelate decarboxylase [Thermomicrobiaceae bacterium]